MSDEMRIKLAQYFGLKGVELEYFEAIAMADHADPSVRELSKTKIENLKKAQACTELVSYENATMLTLMGEVSSQKSIQLLQGSDLEPFLLMGRATLLITITQYGDTSLGPYSEFHLGIMSRKKQTLFQKMGVAFFGALCSQPHVIEYYQNSWNIPYRMGALTLARDHKNDVVTGIAKDGSHELCLKISDVTRCEQFKGVKDEVVAYTETLKDRIPYYIHMNSDDYRKPFTESDAFNLSPNHPLEVILKDLEFSPAGWSYYENMHGRVVSFSESKPS